MAAGPLGGPYKTRTALHVVSDWPGYFPNGPAIARLVLSAGADPNYRDPEPKSETPSHWAANSDDIDVAAALIDGGADIEVPDGSIGTPLDNASGYACWNVADSWWPAGPGSTSSATSVRSASSTASEICSTALTPEPRCRRVSGTPVPVASAAPPSDSSPVMRR